MVTARAAAARLARLAPGVLAIGLLGGCSLVTDSFVTNEFSGDPFPTVVDTSTGAVIVGVRKGGSDDRVGILDILAPLTLLDPGLESDGSIAPASITTGDLTLLGKQGNGELDLPRALLDSKAVVSLHPCAAEPCTVGPAGADLPFRAVIGADALAGDALRLRLGDDQIVVLPDIGGTDLDRTYECDALFPAPFRGGGTLLVEGTAVPYGGRRVAMQACLGANPSTAVVQAERGTDLLTVVSTGLGVSLLGTSAYERYRLATPGVPDLATLPDEIVMLASGPISGRRITVPNLALVGDSGSTPRGPCRQVYAHHLLAERDCKLTVPDRDDCPCTAGNRFCAVPAVVEVEPRAGVDFLVVADDNQTLLALRTELRPDQPEVDAILGTSALRSLEVDIDYPHNRVLARCSGPGCVTRPALNEAGKRARVNLCIAEATSPADPGPVN